MKQPRLTWLLLCMVVLIAIRWLVPNTPTASSENLASEDVVQPVIHPGSTPPVQPTPTSMRIPSAHPSAAETTAGDASEVSLAAPYVAPSTVLSLDFVDTGHASNAFAVRLLPVVVAVPPPPPVTTVVVAAPQPQLSLPPPAPPAPPPLQVIGTWDDGAAPGVFVSTPNGAVLARTGVVLMMEYRVIAITAQQLTLEQLSSKREIQLPVPRVASR